MFFESNYKIRNIYFITININSLCDIKEMVKRDLEIERRRAVADSRNNPY